MLFTSRKVTAQGLPAETQREVVPPLSEHAARQLLTPAASLLTEEQLRLVLKHCGGLPLALQLVRGQIEQDPDPEIVQSVVKRLTGREPLSHDSSDKLLLVVGDSVECLSGPLCQVWCEVAVLLRDICSWLELELLYGKDQMRELALRSLLQRQPLRGDRRECAQVHDVLLSYAYQHCCKGRSSQHYPRLADYYKREPQDIDMADLVS